MKYYFIYSAGGGAGDWNGLKRIWNQSMPISLKSNILLKFGDVFFNHSPKSISTPLIKPTKWSQVIDLRQWLFSAVNDNYVLNTSNILLDSGTSKIVNYIVTLSPSFTEAQIINEFINIVSTKGIIQKYINIINNSNIDEAVTFDIPNPFKIRTQSLNTRTNVFSSSSTQTLIREAANYCNQMYGLLGSSQHKILTTINGMWSTTEIQQFNKLLNYVPEKIAVGGLTRVNKVNFLSAIKNIDAIYNIKNLKRVHFLGCGGLENVSIIKSAGFNFNHVSVDNSTPFNRAIDGNTLGTSQSGYYDYINNSLHRVNPTTVQNILSLHNQSLNPHFTHAEMQAILNEILNHQNSNSGLSTYENRARLIIHNHDVFAKNAI